MIDIKKLRIGDRIRYSSGFSVIYYKVIYISNDSNVRLLKSKNGWIWETEKIYTMCQSDILSRYGVSLTNYEEFDKLLLYKYW